MDDVTAGNGMEGRVCVITGATSGGIGTAAAAELARRGATVVLVARSRERAERTRAAVAPPGGADRVHVVLADLAVQAQVRQAAAELRERWPAVHVLVNSAAVYTSRRQLSPDGIELQFAVNHLAAFLLTNLLLDDLRSNAPARVVTLSSTGHRYARLHLDDPGMSRGYHGLRQYCNTKLCNVLFTRELARRVPPAEVTANTMHPGVVATDLLFNGWSPLRLLRPFIRTPEEGARTAVHLAASPEVAGVTGTYFFDERPARPSSAALEDDDARRLWALSAEMTGLA